MDRLASTALRAAALAFVFAACDGRGERPAAPTPASPEEVRVVPALHVRLPDDELVDQDGAPVRLPELLGEGTAAINFVFTTCTTICSPMTAIFSKLQRDLGHAAGRDVRLVTISLDPAVDTPDRLRRYADQFGRRPGWSFLTGRPERVRRVLGALGGEAPVKERHAPMTLLGSAAEGRWTRVYGIATAERLAAEMRALAAGRAAARSRGHE